MGKMNLLKADYQGQVGETYGYRRKKTSVICAVPFSHAPHNAKQKAAFSAFSALQKLNGLVARHFFEFTGWSDKNKNKINVVAENFKELIANRVYNPEKITEILPNDHTFTLTEVKDEQNNQIIKITVENTNASKAPQKDEVFIAIMGLDNVPINYVKSELAEGEQTFTIENLANRPYCVIGFKAVWNDTKWHLADGIFYTETPDVFKGVWYLDRLNSITPVTIANEVLSFNLAGARVENERLIINY